MPIVVSAQGFDQPSQILTTDGRIVTAEDPAQAAEYGVTNFAPSEANSEFSALSSSLIGDRLKYPSLSLSYDEAEVQIEGMSVYGLYEAKN